MQQQIESWLREVGSRVVVSTGDEQHEALAMVSPYRSGPFACPRGESDGVVADEGEQVVFLTRYPIQAGQVERIVNGAQRYTAYACSQLSPQVYRARLQKEE